MAQRPTALVTGGTAGLGLAFARALAESGHDLVLVARDEARLRDTAAELQQRFGAVVETVSADLTRREDVLHVARRLSDPARPVDMLVNNAGFGVNRFFVGGSLDEELGQVDILVTAVLALSHAAAPAMKSRGHGVIVNVASVSGFTVQASYSAAKAWAITFTEVLAGELRGSGVTATALCPGFVRTEFHQRAGMDMRGTPRWMWLDADEVVATCLADVAAGKIVSIPGGQYRFFSGFLRVIPRGLRWWIFWGRPGAKRSGARR